MASEGLRNRRILVVEDEFVIAADLQQHLEGIGAVVIGPASSVEKAVSIIGSAFLKQAAVVSKGLGVPLAMGVYPGAPMVDSEEELRRKVEEVLAPGLLKGLIGDAPEEGASAVEHQPGVGHETLLEHLGALAQRTESR